MIKGIYYRSDSGTKYVRFKEIDQNVSSPPQIKITNEMEEFMAVIEDQDKISSGQSLNALEFSKIRDSMVRLYTGLIITSTVDVKSTKQIYVMKDFTIESTGHLSPLEKLLSIVVCKQRESGSVYFVCSKCKPGLLQLYYQGCEVVDSQCSPYSCRHTIAVSSHFIHHPDFDVEFDTDDPEKFLESFERSLKCFLYKESDWQPGNFLTDFEDYQHKKKGMLVIFLTDSIEINMFYYGITARTKRHSSLI
jgi:hypothetical protein